MFRTMTVTLAIPCETRSVSHHLGVPEEHPIPSGVNLIVHTGIKQYPVTTVTHVGVYFALNGKLACPLALLGFTDCILHHVVRRYA